MGRKGAKVAFGVAANSRLPLLTRASVAPMELSVRRVPMGPRDDQVLPAKTAKEAIKERLENQGYEY